MPAKTIYVSNDDQPVFDRAQELAGENLSSVISISLREFIVRKEALGKGMKEIAIQVGTKGLQREKRFNGRLLMKWNGLSEDKHRWLQAKVYKTAKDKLAVELVISPRPDVYHQPDYWKYGDFTPESELLIFDSIDEAVDKLPKSLITLMRQADERDDSPVEFLDI